jgi:hypothetical protein
MATTKKPTRKGLPKKKKVNNGPSIFEFLNDITYHKKNILSPDNEHSYSPFMIVRFLATKQDLIEYCDFLNKHLAHMDKYQFHETAIYMCPITEKFFMNGKKVSYTPKIGEVTDDLEWIQKQFKISQEKAYGYYLTLGKGERVELVTNIKLLHGIID